MNLTDTIQSVLFGVATGDALGVPVEFRSRFELEKSPVTDMMGYGTYNLPPGTWSDDSSMTFCLAESLCNGFDLRDIAQSFVRWYGEGYWTPHGSVFDIGMTTRAAINRLMRGERPDLAGGMSVSDNGNGSLMRISPLLFYIYDKPIRERYEVTKLVSSVTHGHIRSAIACFYYLEFMCELLTGKDLAQAYRAVAGTVNDFLEFMEINPQEIRVFHRLLYNSIGELDEASISGSGYVVHTLEASMWCLLTTADYKSAVLKAVNLGEDTDTTAAVTGGLAGLLYGLDAIPQEWRDQLARKDDISYLSEKLAMKLSNE
jgi:ADP-ribosylglycohydrolase